MANVSVSTSSSPADDPAWPNDGSDSSSCTQPSTSNCFSMSSASSANEAPSGIGGTASSTPALRSALESWITVRPGIASHDGSGPFRPMP